MRSFIILLLIALICTPAIYAGETGKLNGFIKEKETGEVLIGANVVVLGTTLGADSTSLITFLPALTVFRFQ